MRNINNVRPCALHSRHIKKIMKKLSTVRRSALCNVMLAPHLNSCAVSCRDTRWKILDFLQHMALYISISFWVTRFDAATLFSVRTPALFIAHC